jgi:hypothetical protein
MDPLLAKAILSRFNKYAFEAFLVRSFQLWYGMEHFRPFEPSPDQVFIRDLEDYIYGTPEDKHYGLFDAAYVSHFFPAELLRDPKDAQVTDPLVVRNLELVRNYYSGKIGHIGLEGPVEPKLQLIFFLNNFVGFSSEDYRSFMIPKYEALIQSVDLEAKNVGVGNFDSFFELKPQPADDAFRQFISTRSDGLCISISPHDIAVRPYVFEKCSSTGVTAQSKSIYEPAFVPTSVPQASTVLQEFERLLHADPTEAQLEEFLHSNYALVFGAKYDRIETQLWLRFPEFDIAGKPRRMDVFLRNSVTDDWELFEIKRLVKVTNAYRDVPVLSSELLHAIQQVKNYQRILLQDATKRYFDAQGISYYEPVLHLVVGRQPQIHRSQWRWLLSEHKDVKILTFDDLLKEMQVRVNDWARLQQQLSAGPHSASSRSQ